MKVSTRYSITALLLAASAASAQVVSTGRTIELRASKGPYVTVGAPNLTTQEVPVVDSAATEFPSAFTTTVSWDVPNGATTVKLVAYFATPDQALTNSVAGTYIPSSMIEVSVVDGVWVPLTGSAVGSVGVGGGSAVLYTSGATTGGNKKASSLVTFKVRVNLTDAYREAGMYIGTLNLMAICS